MIYWSLIEDLGVEWTTTYTTEYHYIRIKAWNIIDLSSSARGHWCRAKVTTCLLQTGFTASGTKPNYFLFVLHVGLLKPFSWGHHSKNPSVYRKESGRKRTRSGEIIDNVQINLHKPTITWRLHFFILDELWIHNVVALVLLPDKREKRLLLLLIWITLLFFQIQTATNHLVLYKVH